MATGNQRFSCSNPSCPGGCCTSWSAQHCTLSPTFTWHKQEFQPTTWRHLVKWVARSTPHVPLTKTLFSQRGRWHLD